MRPLGYFPVPIPDYEYGWDCVDRTGLQRDPITGEFFLGLVHCYGDVRDTTYAVGAQAPLAGRRDFVLAFGANHEESGAVVYNNLAFYNAFDNFSTVVKFGEAMTPPGAPGAMRGLDPAIDPENARKLYVVAFARNCTLLEDTEFAAFPCEEIPFGDFPAIAPEKRVYVVQRAYVDPVTTVAPARGSILFFRTLFVTEAELV